MNGMELDGMDHGFVEIEGEMIYVDFSISAEKKKKTPL